MASAGAAQWQREAGGAPAEGFGVEWIGDAGARLLLVTLDGVGVAHLRLVGILSELCACASLPEQVPAPVELDLDSAQSMLVFLQPFGVAAVGLLAATQGMLLRDEVLDPVGDAVVAHGTARMTAIA